MTDPLNDPRFPDRPTHPDFWRISEVLTQLDGKATEGGHGLPEIVAAVADLGSVTYAARQRARMIKAQTGLDFVSEELLAAVWIDAFTTGATFQERGGHRHDGEP